jgi:glycosyltransferase involved in cell wall biosynthesis/predicted O-methyltransferase YrrM
MADKIAIFYHIYQENHWAELFERQIIALQQSGLYDAANHIHFGINGDKPLPFDLIKVKSIKRNIKTDTEADTLLDLYKFALQNPNYKILYMHTKGAGWSVEKIKKDTHYEVIKDILHVNVNHWANYLGYFNINRWKDCVSLLNEYDCVGTEWEKEANLGNHAITIPHYSGNFWWANSEYISQLDPGFLYENNPWKRHQPEFWIGTRNPHYFNYYTSGKNKYLKPVEASEYENLPIRKQVNVMNRANREKVIDGILSSWKPQSIIAHWLVNELKANTIVDLGVDYGYSTFTFALPEVGTVYGIDNFKPDPHTGSHPDQKEKLFAALKQLDLKNVEIVEGNFSEVAQIWEKPIDILHIDGYHAYESVKENFENWSKFLTENGVVLFHNTKVVRETFGVNKFFKELNWPKLNLKSGYGLGIATKNTKLLELISAKFSEIVEAESPKGAKICMISMFKNEANNIRKMLDSVAPYIKYWVLQDNGSTDGTVDIVKQWAAETNIPGYLYKVEEGWVNFGWNRDHLLQTALKRDHGCDWIMKMDCDETLEVGADFDWSIFEDTRPQSFHVTSIAPGLIYYRAWIWNAKLPWKFNHDPAHETITLEMDGIGENFVRTSLPKSFRMIGGVSHGESYSVPTKYVTDALKLEEKLIREGTMLTDLYHFWYIGKSYEDCYRGNFFPLKEVHQEEYARRCIFYFNSVVNHTHNFNETQKAAHIDEMAYYAICAIGNAYRFLKEYDKAIWHYEKSEQFAEVRNDHHIHLAEIYWELQEWDKMHKHTSFMMRPERTNPFPSYHFLINTNMYYDTGEYPKYLHNIATENLNKEKPVWKLNAKSAQKKRIFVVDNFYADPYAVRNYALKQNFEGDIDWYKGKRTKTKFLTSEMKKSFEELMGIKIQKWDHGMNGSLQYCTPEDLLVYHYDSQTWAGAIYLTPDAPFDTGTSLFAHKKTRIRHMDEPGADQCFAGGFYDSTQFELVDTIGNVFNRLVIWDARSFHAANKYFGTNLQDSRLFHLFFFD